MYQDILSNCYLLILSPNSGSDLSEKNTFSFQHKNLSHTSILSLSVPISIYLPLSSYLSISICLSVFLASSLSGYLSVYPSKHVHYIHVCVHACVYV